MLCISIISNGNGVSRVEKKSRAGGGAMEKEHCQGLGHGAREIWGGNGRERYEEVRKILGATRSWFTKLFVGYLRMGYPKQNVKWVGVS